MLKKLLMGAVGLVATSAAAADFPVAPPSALPPAPSYYRSLGWELRAGAFAHDPTSPEAGSVDLNGELILPKFYSVTNSYLDLAIPRADVGFTANFAGKTSNTYADLVWTFDLPYRFFVEGQFGGAVNDGKTGRVAPPGFNRVGCNASFHESGSLGYRLTENWSVMGTLEHFSNAGFCVQNRGVTNYGLRIGYRF